MCACLSRGCSRYSFIPITMWVRIRWWWLVWRRLPWKSLSPFSMDYPRWHRTLNNACGGTEGLAVSLIRNMEGGRWAICWKNEHILVLVLAQALYCQDARTSKRKAVCISGFQLCLVCLESFLQTEHAGSLGRHFCRSCFKLLSCAPNINQRQSEHVHTAKFRIWQPHLNVGVNPLNQGFPYWVFPY